MSASICLRQLISAAIAALDRPWRLAAVAAPTIDHAAAAAAQIEPALCAPYNHKRPLCCCTLMAGGRSATYDYE